MATGRRADLDRRRAGAHGNRCADYNQAINTVMVSKFTQGGEKLDDVIKWAGKELEATLRA